MLDELGIFPVVQNEGGLPQIESSPTLCEIPLAWRSWRVPQRSQLGISTKVHCHHLYFQALHLSMKVRKLGLVARCIGKRVVMRAGGAIAQSVRKEDLLGEMLL